MDNLKDKLIKGLKFKSNSFAATVEIAAIREKQNEVDLIFIPTDGNAFEQKNENLKQLVDGFKAGKYIDIEPDKFTVGIW